MALVMSQARLFALDGSKRDNVQVQEWLSSPGHSSRKLARHWFDVWRSCGDDVEEVLHDGQPTACIQGIALGYVTAFQAHINVGFYLGATLPDPAGLLRGHGKYMRHVRVSADDPNHVEQLKALMRAAYEDLKDRLAEATRGPADE